MNNEVTLQEIIAKTILFFDRNIKLIILITLSGFIITFTFQKLKPDYFSTTAIAKSGLAAFERLEDDDILNQRTAIDIINNLQENVKKDDYKALSSKLDISVSQASKIKYIGAEQLFRIDENENEHNTSKFRINLSVTDRSIIPVFQEGLINYFESNTYISDYHKIYLQTNDTLLKSIKQEIKEYRSKRANPNSKIETSSITVNDRNKAYGSNEVLNLSIDKAIIITHNKMLKPLRFVESFSQTTMPERDIVIWGSAISFLSFLLSIIIAIVREVKRSDLKSNK